MATRSVAITMINPLELRAHSFFESHCWEKLKSIVFCAVHWHGKNSPTAELMRVTSFDFAETDDLILEIKADYDIIRAKVIEKGFESLTGRDGKWIQARTKGAGHGSTSRVFYAKKGLVQRIFEMSDAENDYQNREAA
jgi:DNA mismatch repair protein MutH